MNFKKKLAIISIGLLTPIFLIAEDASNPYQCSNEELQSYIKNKMSYIEKAQPAGETWENHKTAYIEQKKQEAEKKGEEDVCGAFWEESEDLRGLIDGAKDIIDAAGNLLSNPGQAFNNALNDAKDRTDALLEALGNQLAKGMCERLSENYLGGKLIERGQQELDKATEDTDLNLRLNTDIINQLVDQTVCSDGGAVDDVLNYGSKSCDLLLPSGDSQGDRVRERAAGEAVDELYFNDIDNILWGNED